MSYSTQVIESGVGVVAYSGVTCLLYPSDASDDLTRDDSPAAPVPDETKAGCVT